MPSALGVFGNLPIDLLSEVCKNLPMYDIVTMSQLDGNLKYLVETIIYREIKGIRVEANEQNYLIHFTHKDGHTTSLDLKHVDWEDVMMFGKCIESLELDISPQQSTSQLFHVLKRCSFALKSLKIKINECSDVHKFKKVTMGCIALASQHRATLAHLEASTSDEQHVVVDIQKADVRMTYNQGVEPKSEQEKQSKYCFVINLFHSVLEYRQIRHVSLQIDTKFDANLALQNASLIAIPHPIRRLLETLSIDFGTSLNAVTEEKMKEILLRHVDFHLSTPNLHHFHCNLPHDQIDLSQEFLAQLSEPVRRSRRYPSSRPYNSSISSRTVKCK